jgi:hypothetical protein
VVRGGVPKNRKIPRHGFPKFSRIPEIISTGRGNLISRAEKLRDLGVNAAKSLPLALVDQAVASDADDVLEILPKTSTVN